MSFPVVVCISSLPSVVPLCFKQSHLCVGLRCAVEPQANRIGNRKQASVVQPASDGIEQEQVGVVSVA